MIESIALLVAATAAQGGICPNAVSSVEIIECVNAAYRGADGRMTTEWKRAYARMKKKDAHQVSRQTGPSFLQALLDSQRKWLAFRDSQCRVEGYRMRGGSGQGYSTTICLITLTNDRTDALRRIDF
jgi:uncharacterized protein YecT (DUF1311 family)